MSLLLAMVGVLTTWLAWPLGLAASYWIGRRIPADDSLTPWWVASIVLLMAAVVTTIGLVAPHEWVFAGRDAGTYTTTAAWIAQNGSILIETGAEHYAGLDVTFDSPGFIASPDTTVIYPQFMHVFPVLMGLAGMTFGLHAILAIGPIVGGICVLVTYLLANRFVGRGWALLATVVIAAGLPFLYYTRAPYSETLALLFTLAGIWLGMRAISSRDKVLANLAGVSFGAVFVARIDGVLVLLGLVAFVGGLELLGRDQDMPFARRMRMWALVVSILGWADGLFFSPYYVAYHGRFAVPVMIAMLVVWIAVPIVRKTAFGHLLADHRINVGYVVMAALALWLLYSASNPVGEASTGAWLSWYLGLPLLVCALIGMLWSVHRFVAGGAVEPFLPASILAVVASVYMFRPSVAPDHIWAMRRFLPAILPLVVILGIWLVEQATKRWPKYRLAIAPVAVAAFLVPGLAVTIPLGGGAELEGVSTAMDEACETIGQDAVVLLRHELESHIVMPPLRGWCDVPVARLITGSDAEVEKWAASVSDNGRTPLVSSKTWEERDLTVMNTEFRILEIALESPPREWLDLVRTVALSEAP